MDKIKILAKTMTKLGLIKEDQLIKDLKDINKIPVRSIPRYVYTWSENA